MTNSEKFINTLIHNCSPISVPLDVAIVKREHFNRHYSSMAYYLAFNIADSPLLIGNSLMSSLVAYAMAGMPFEPTRIVLVIVIGFMVSFLAQIFGIFCGSMSNVVVSNHYDSNKFKFLHIQYQNANNGFHF